MSRVLRGPRKTVSGEGRPKKHRDTSSLSAAAASSVSPARPAISPAILAGHPWLRPQPASKEAKKKMGERNWGGQMTALEARFDKFTKGYGCDTAIDFVGRAGGRRQQAGPGALLYGEIEFCAVAMLFRSLRVDHGLLTKRGGRFLDIGSGLGKTVIAAALLHEFDACSGVEIVDKHWARSQGLGKAWAKKCGRGASKKKTGLWGRKNTRVASGESTRAATVDYVLGDALEHDWSKADVVFINCTGFVSSPEMMAKLQGKADELPPGTILITTSVPLTTESYGGKRSPRSNWETLSTEGCLQMSWGRGVAYIQRKIRDVPLFKSDARLDQIVNVAWAKPQDEGHRLRWPYCHAAFTELLVPVQMKPENTTQTLAPSVCVASTPERRRTTGLLYTGVAGSFIGRLC